MLGIGIGLGAEGVGQRAEGKERGAEGRGQRVTKYTLCAMPSAPCALRSAL